LHSKKKVPYLFKSVAAAPWLCCNFS
jgi:hypothetical protein